MARKGFWGKFDDLMDSLPGYIEEQTDKAKKDGTYHETIQTSSYSSSTSTINQDGKKIKVVTKNGKTTITVDGKEYVEKK